MRRRAASRFGALLIAAGVTFSATKGNTAAVSKAKTACEIVKAQVSASRHFPISVIAFCDIIPARSSPKAYYVLALHSRRQCEGICSTNMGWFAVQKLTGRVFEWDMAEEKPGPRVKVSP
jgi:hypothetical protein